MGLGSNRRPPAPPADPTPEQLPPVAPTKKFFNTPPEGTAPQIDPLAPDQVNSAFAPYFKDTPYAGSDVLNKALNQAVQYHHAFLSGAGGGSFSDAWKTATANGIKQYTDTFTQMFQDKVGRPPTQDEYGTFFNQVLIPDGPWTGTDIAKVKEDTRSGLSDFFSQAAQENAQKKAQDAGTAAVAPGSAFDQWATGYRNNVSGVEQSLQDFQDRLMEKIRPQLLTSLQSQGLLNTGGLNEAFAGVSGDLTAEAQSQMRTARMGAEQDINNQKFNLLSLPYQQQQQYTLGTIPNVLSSGENALNRTWQGYMQNQNFQNQMALQNAQSANQPSLLQQYGGLILGGTAGGLGQGFGKRLATAGMA